MHHFGYIMTANKVLDFKQSLKKLKKKVKQLEAERDLNRSWNHKEILIDAKKKKLQMKQLLDELEDMNYRDKLAGIHQRSKFEGTN